MPSRSNEEELKDLLAIDSLSTCCTTRRFLDYARNDIDTIPYFSPFTSHFSLCLELRRDAYEHLEVDTWHRT